MWADAGGVLHKISAMNPLRRSTGGLDKIMRELLGEPGQRPVELHMEDDSGQVFENPKAAARSLCEHLVKLRVCFQVRCGCEPGQYVILTGSSEEFGSWDVAKSVRLHTTPEDYPIWTTEDLSCVGLLTPFEYKYAVCDNSGTPLRFEGVAPRVGEIQKVLPDFAAQGLMTVVDGSLGLTPERVQVRFDPSWNGLEADIPLEEESSAMPNEEEEEEEPSRPQGVVPATFVPGSFGGTHFPRMVWDHRCPTDTTRIEERYSLGKTLGSGNFGMVREAKSRAKKNIAPRAVKLIRKEKIRNITEFNNEVSMMELMDHPNIVRLFEVFEDHRNVYLVLQLCEGGDMLELMLDRLNHNLGGYNEPEAAHFLRQMTAAVQHCHRQDVAHRDVKLDNFLVVDRRKPSMEQQVKLCDMGLARKVPQGGFPKACGSFSTLAPEVLLANHGGPPYGLPCDMWSIGSVLYSLLSCDIAQGPETGDGWEDRLKMGIYNMETEPWLSVSKDVCRMIRALMCKDVNTRLTAEQCLKQSWLSQDGPNKSFRPAQGITFVTAENISEGLNRWFGKCRLSHFQKTALHVLAQQDGASKKLEEAFRRLDTDKSGQVPLRQLVDVLATILPNGEDNPSVREWRETILPKLPENASLGQTEFLAATLRVEEDRCWDVFRFFDRDRDGTISLEDLKGLFPEASKNEVFAKEVAALGGRVTFEIFAKLMRESTSGEGVTASKAT